VTKDEQTELWWQSVSFVIGVVVLVATVMPENKGPRFMKIYLRNRMKEESGKQADGIAMVIAASYEAR